MVLVRTERLAVGALFCNRVVCGFFILISGAHKRILHLFIAVVQKRKVWYTYVHGGYYYFFG